MRRALATYAVQVRAAMRTTTADPAAFALQFGAMLVNNGFVMLLWFLFFAGFERIGGWRLPDLALLVGLLATVVGLSGVVAGGYRDMARNIVGGVPDVLLSQPGPVLPRLLAQESIVIGWGDMVTGAVLLTAFANLAVADIGWLLLVLGCAVVIYLSTATAFASLAFWAGGARSLARDLTDFMILFGSYPGSIYSGATKFVVYTVFPAGFIVLMPVAILRAPDAVQAALLVAAALGYAVAAVLLFEAGLARYRRGESPVADS